MADKKRNSLKLRDFRGRFQSDHETRVPGHQENTDQMLLAGRTKKQRAALSGETGIPEDALLELVKLSDLARLPGVKGIRARFTSRRRSAS